MSWPLTLTSSCQGLTLTPMACTVSPLSWTWPWRINSSALRREHSPLAAIYLFRRCGCFLKGLARVRELAPERLGLFLAGPAGWAAAVGLPVGRGCFSWVGLRAAGFAFGGAFLGSVGFFNGFFIALDLLGFRQVLQ